MNKDPSITDPHRYQPVRTTGATLQEAKAVMVMLHGRGATAEDILSLSAEFRRQDFAYLAPQAAANTWYPEWFMTPIERNEPWLTSALAFVNRLVQEVEKRGIPAERLILLGFSQGACLALEWAARNARRYGGVAGLTGGLIGPDGTPRDYPGSLDGTPVFIGCSDVDFHIPKERAEFSAEVLERLGAKVTLRLYPGMGHTINQDEINFVREMVEKVAK